MPFVRKCVKCGMDLTDPAAMKCPACGAPVITPVSGKIWIVVLFQIVMASAFMLVFHFPKPMIGVMILFILMGSGLSAWCKRNPGITRPIPQRAITQPVLFRLLSLGMAISGFAIFATLLFGFAIFMNAWNTWHRYAGLAHHEADFIVTAAYYQRGSRGSVDVYAKGTVEGNREWISLMPYLHTRPHGPEELEERVPVGTTIHIDYYPSLKGRSRTVVFTGVPPDEANHRLAMKALNGSAIGIAIAAALMFLLSRWRRTCYTDDTQASLSPVSASGI